jgi:RHS repeat-associated protein
LVNVPRTTGGGTGTDGTYERQRIYLTDLIGSPVAILDNANASVVERISYDAYGNARHHSPADLDGNGAVDGWDQALLLGAWGDDVADIADIDRNGDVDGWDQALLLYYWGDAMPAGWISYAGEDNPLGFAGYMHNKEAPGSAGGVYLARLRWYDPLLGRWLSRDPAGYVDGLNLYLYVACNPLVLIDPWGLEAEGDGWWCAILSLPRRVKTGIEEAAKDIIILGGNTLGLVDDEHLEESGLYNEIYGRSYDVNESTLGGNIADMYIDGVVDTAKGLVSGDPQTTVDAAATVVTIVATRRPARSGKTQTTAGTKNGNGNGNATNVQEYTRLERDIKATGHAPLGKNPVGRRVGNTPAQNNAVARDVAELDRMGATDIRVDQQQVNASGRRVGINRPDLQYTVNGKRYYTEYDRTGKGRSFAHEERIRANDPDAGGVLLRTLD